MYLAKLFDFFLWLSQVAFILIALLSLGNGRAVVPKTAPWPTVEEKFIQEQTTIKDGASGLQNQRSSMLTEEPTPNLQMRRLDVVSESPNEVHGPIVNAVEEKRQKILSRLKRNACVKGTTKYNEDGLTYGVVQCQSYCYPVYAKTKKGTAIVANCVKKVASG